jgi:glyoxylase-like metal-dependent hydrolase (beta-lactamase superfamily II)
MCRDSVFGGSRPRRPRPPPLDAGYALTLADIFERAIAAIWRAHGDRMAELIELRDATAVRRSRSRPTTTARFPTTTSSDPVTGQTERRSA